MVFADPEEVEPDLIRQNPLFDEVPDRLGMRQRLAVRIESDVTEGIQPEDEREVCHC